MADSGPNVFDSTTVVSTRQRGTAVTANLLVNLRFGSARGARTCSLFA